MERVKKLAMRTVGIVLIPLGIVGLFLPFLQGILFIALGVGLLMASSESFRSRVKAFAARSQRLHSFVERAEAVVLRMFKKDRGEG